MSKSLRMTFDLYIFIDMIQSYLYQNKLVVSFSLQFLEFHCKTHVTLYFDLAAHESLLWIEFTTHHIDKVLILNYNIRILTFDLVYWFLEKIFRQTILVE